jgi:hypothetical protein
MLGLNDVTVAQRQHLRNFPVRKTPYAFYPNFPTHLPLLFKQSHLALCRRRNMAQVFFHCSNAEGVWIDRRGAAVGNLVEAHEQAAIVVRSLLMAQSTEDWRGWVLHVSDDLGEEIFAVPFVSMLGKPN